MQVDATGAALLAGAVLVSVGVAVVARRVGPRHGRSEESAGAGALPEGMEQVLAVLRSATLVLDRHDDLVRVAPSAVALGVVRDGELRHAEVSRAVGAVRKDGRPRTLRVRQARGRGRPVELTLRVARLGEGRVLVLIDDSSEAQRVDDVRRDFLANVSHELKTPVAALSLLAESVEVAADDPVAVERFAGRMKLEATRLTTLIRELIELSRVQGDMPLAHAKVIPVDELVQDAVDRTRFTATAAEIDLVVAVDSDLRVYGDQEQLVSALKNLIDNAVAYSPPRTRVAVAAREVGDRIEITVTDQGIGIPQRDLNRVFERFYRVDPARSRDTGGTGLGLAIVKHVCANHGGDVAVWSVEGAGSTFTLRLPAQPPQDSSPAVTTPDIAHDAATLSESGRTVP